MPWLNYGGGGGGTLQGGESKVSRKLEVAVQLCLQMESDVSPHIRVRARTSYNYRGIQGVVNVQVAETCAEWLVVEH